MPSRLGMWNQEDAAGFTPMDMVAVQAAALECKDVGKAAAEEGIRRYKNKMGRIVSGPRNSIQSANK